MDFYSGTQVCIRPCLAETPAQFTNPNLLGQLCLHCYLPWKNSFKRRIAHSFQHCGTAITVQRTAATTRIYECIVKCRANNCNHVHFTDGCEVRWRVWITSPPLFSSVNPPSHQPKGPISHIAPQEPTSSPPNPYLIGCKIVRKSGLQMCLNGPPKKSRF